MHPWSQQLRVIETYLPVCSTSKRVTSNRLLCLTDIAMTGSAIIGVAVLVSWLSYVNSGLIAQLINSGLIAQRINSGLIAQRVNSTPIAQRINRCSTQSWRYRFNLNVSWKVCPRLGRAPRPRLSLAASRQLRSFYRAFFRRSKNVNPTSDGDLCCPTTMTLERNETLTNVDGEVKQLVHLTRLYLYQWVNFASCDLSECLSADGRCVLEYKTEYLLVWNSRGFPPFVFDAFLIPKYCSCKNI